MQIQLYHLQHCPYSRKVRDFIEANGLRERIDYRDIGQAEADRARLESLIGKHQVPCLVIDGEPLLESDAIVDWLERRCLSRGVRT